MCLCQMARTHYLQMYNDPLYKKKNFNTYATRFPCRALTRKSITIVVPHQRSLHILIITELGDLHYFEFKIFQPFDQKK